MRWVLLVWLTALHGGCHLILPLAGRGSDEDAAVAQDLRPDRRPSDTLPDQPPLPDMPVLPTHGMAPAWSVQLAGMGSDEPAAVEVGPSGAIYITGLFQDDLHLGTKSMVASASSAELFVARIKADGTPDLLYQPVGTSTRSEGNDLTVDSTGKLRVAGSFSNAITFGTSKLVGDSGDLFQATFDANVAAQSGKGIPGAGYEWAHSLALAPADGLLLTGAFSSTMSWDKQLNSHGNSDMFVARVDATGAPQWSRAVGTAQTDWPGDIVCDGQGNSYLVGYVGVGAVQIDGTPTGLQPQAREAVLLSFAPNGDPRWNRLLGAGPNGRGTAAAVDATRVCVAGVSSGAADLGGGPDPGFGKEDGFLVLLDAAGGYQWSKLVGGADDDAIGGVALLPGEVVAVVGTFSGTIDLKGDVLAGKGTEDLFVAKYDAAGKLLWSASFGSSDEVTVERITADAAGNLYVVGEFQGALDLGKAGVLTNTDGGFPDGYLLKLAPQ